MDAGTITFSTALDNSQLESELKQAEKEIKSTQDKLNKTESEKSFIEKQMDEANAAIYETEQRIESLKAKLADIPSVTHSVQDYRSNADTIASIREELEGANSTLASQIEESDKLNSKWQSANQKAQEYAQQIENAKTKQRDLSQEYARSYSSNTQAISGALSSAEERFSKFSGRINTMFKKVFLFGVILSGIRALKGYITDAIEENDALARSFNGVHAIMAGFAAGILNAVLPALLGFITIVANMLTTLARLIDMVFQTNIVKSIEAAKKAAGSVKKQTKATKDLAKAQKEANAQLMAFDEINKMEDNSDQPSTGASGGAGGSDFAGLDIGAIDDTLAAIMGILGAALLAVGAILCFSGINIPLGIGLMAIGALMIYTVAQENWSKLPQEVRDAISAALIITGIVILVIGVVLAFSGAAIPVGIGMIAAGAALIWAAIALNWNSMSQDVRNAVSALMVLLGGALLVIGAVLAFSGAGLPLGIGLMAAGAATIVGAAALNWNDLPEEIQTAISVIFAVISVAFLVLGAILALSGTAVPLGVGLLIVGAGLLVSAVALNWDKLPQDVKNTVSTLLMIIGSALIVIGIILLCTGVGIPLGIACILAGIGSFVAGAALNWDFLLNKVKDVWHSIVNWWNSTVAPVFTIGFWQDKFKSIVNGLISCLNSGLGSFGGFINGISNGITGLLGNFGIQWQGSVSMPQIPYLAQGAVIPPNRKFMAVLGDQTAGNNLEAPESLIRKIIREESGGNAAEIAQAVEQGVIAALSFSSLGSQENDTDVTIVLQVGNEELARATNKGNRRLQQRGEIKGELQFV